MKKTLALLGAIALFSFAGSASADMVWSWSEYNVNLDGQKDTLRGSGSLTTAGTATSPEEILAFSGTWQGSNVTGIVPVDPQMSGFLYNNLFQNGSPFLDWYGVLFSVENSPPVNIYWNQNHWEEAFYPANSDPRITQVIFEVARGGTADSNAVPEPGSLALAGFAFAGALAVRRRNKKNER
jgi:hypothetical protein